MKINIANKKTYYLSDSLNLEERLAEVELLLNDKLKFDDGYMTVNEYFSITWNRTVGNRNPTQEALDRLGTYLSKMPDQDGKQDKETLSKNDIMEMEKGIRRVHRKGENLYESGRYVVYSDLSLEAKSKIGLTDIDSSETY